MAFWGPSKKKQEVRIGTELLESMYWDWVSPLALERVMLAQELSEKGPTISRVQHYIAASELEPTWFAPHFALGSCLAILGEHDNAIHADKKAISLEPGFPANALQSLSLLQKLRQVSRGSSGNSMLHRA